MKVAKTIILFATISLFTLITYNSANAAVDCSDPQGFHAKMTCKLKSMTSSGSSDSGSSDSGSSNKLKKKGGGIWEKIKNFGGKNIGEAG